MKDKIGQLLAAGAMVALTFTAAGEARALTIDHAHVNSGYGTTFVTLNLEEPVKGRVVVAVYVNGEVWRMKSWHTFGDSLVELFFDGEPPPGDISISVRPYGR